MSPAKKTATARKRPTAKKTTAKRGVARRKSTAAPKRIINRKKGTARKGTARKAKAAGAGGQKMLERYNQQGSQLAELVDKQGLSVSDAAAKMKISKGKATRLYARAKVKPSQRVVGTDAEVGKAIVKMVDQDGLKWTPDVWARTGLRPVKAKALYKAAGGKGTTGRAAANGTRKKSTAKRTAKGGAARRAKATAGRSKKTTATKKAATPKRAARAGRPKGRRAQREEARELLHDVIWPNDSKQADVVRALEGRTIEVSREINGHPMKPTDHKVVSVADIKMTDKGRIVEYTDEKQQHRFVQVREITALK